MKRAIIAATFFLLATITCKAQDIAASWPKGIYVVCVVVGETTITKQVYVD